MEGIAVGDSHESLTTTNCAHYAFLPVSDPYAAVAVDERTLMVEHLIPGDPTSPALLYFNVLVRDPLAVYAPDPSAYPPSVWVNGDAASSVTYVADPVLCKNAIRRKSTTRIGRRDVSGGGVAVQRDSVAGVAV